jgi:putative SOS response-associated peptidase YedK
MCGRFNLTRTSAVVERFGFVDWHERRIEPRFNIAPSQEILTIVQTPLDGPFAQMATWGLKPFWQKAVKRPPPINARAESLAASPMFRDALAGTRCLIPATGFYEWRTLGGAQVRQPMHIQLKDGAVFAFAGLWLPGNKGGPPTATIITTRPNGLMETIHTRMPAILGPDDDALLAWLDPTVSDPVELMGLLEPYPAELMEAYPVAPLVNSWENEGPDLIAPAAVLNPSLFDEPRESTPVP